MSQMKTQLDKRGYFKYCKDCGLKCYPGKYGKYCDKCKKRRTDIGQAKQKRTSKPIYLAVKDDQS